MGSVYSLDETATLRKSHENPQVKVGARREGGREEGRQALVHSGSSSPFCFDRMPTRLSYCVAPAPHSSALSCVGAAQQ